MPGSAKCEFVETILIFFDSEAVSENLRSFGVKP